MVSYAVHCFSSSIPIHNCRVRSVNRFTPSVLYIWIASLADYRNDVFRVGLLEWHNFGKLKLWDDTIRLFVETRDATLRRSCSF